MISFDITLKFYKKTCRLSTRKVFFNPPPLLPPAARNLFEKRFLDFQKLFIIKSFCRGGKMFHGDGFLEKSPPLSLLSL
jgi:hypothetical protein